MSVVRSHLASSAARSTGAGSAFACFASFRASFCTRLVFARYDPSLVWKVT